MENNLFYKPSQWPLAEHQIYQDLMRDALAHTLQGSDRKVFQILTNDLTPFQFNNYAIRVCSWLD